MSEYKGDLKIDKYSLDEELVNQPSLFMKWAEEYVFALERRDKAKEKLDIVKAEIDADIRNNPKDYGFDGKVTEAGISACIIQQEGYSKVNSELIEANKEVNIYAAAKEAMGHKKSSLAKLVELYLTDYWSEVPLPKKGNDKTTQLKKEREITTQSRMRRKLKKEEE